MLAIVLYLSKFYNALEEFLYLNSPVFDNEDTAHKCLGIEMGKLHYKTTGTINSQIGNNRSNQNGTKNSLIVIKPVMFRSNGTGRKIS